jgi:hypothetical protein
MTDLDKSAEDSTSEGFLERWSRKKIDAAVEPKAESDLAQPSLPEPRADDAPERPVGAATRAEFDLSSLPSLESITAVTDIRAFLGPGVPRELAVAALRRAWAADPAIRNFVGLAENAWDFTDPNAMPGFGALPDGYDIKKLLAQVFGDRDPEADKLKSEPTAVAQAPELTTESVKSSAPVEATAAESQPPGEEALLANPRLLSVEANLVQRDNIIASHQSNPPIETEEPQARRQHGSALPQ